MEIKDAQNLVDQWIKTNGIRYFNELTNMAILTEEVGEVARIISRKYGEQSFKESDKDKVVGTSTISLMLTSLGFFVIALVFQNQIHQNYP